MNTFEKNPLAGIQNQEIFEELAKRFNSYVFVYNVASNEPGVVGSGCTFKGSIAEGVGLANFAEHFMTKELYKATEEQ